MSRRAPAADEEAFPVEQVPLAVRTQPTGRAGRWRYAACVTLIALGLFAAYFRLSWTAPLNSDGAANILQVADMLHGNVLLHGWWLSDVSFYTTELPQYALIEAILGQVPAVVHVASGMTYTLAVLLAALVAKGRANGREGVLRMVIAAGIMLAPQYGGGVGTGGGVFVLDLSLGHIGTSVPLLLTWMVIDQAGTPSLGTASGRDPFGMGADGRLPRDLRRRRPRRRGLRGPGIPRGDSDAPTGRLGVV